MVIFWRFTYTVEDKVFKFTSLATFLSNGYAWILKTQESTNRILFDEATAIYNWNYRKTTG